MQSGASRIAHKGSDLVWIFLQPYTARHLPDSLPYAQVTLFNLRLITRFVGSRPYQNVLASAEDRIVW